MNLLTKHAMAAHVLMLLLALCGAFIILLDILGGMGWNGLNIVVGIYLTLAVLSFFGLLVCLVFGFSKNKFVSVLAAICSGLVLVLASLFAVSFVFGRDAQVPLNEQVTDILGVHALHAPILALYSYSIFVSAILLVLSLFKLRQLRTSR